MSITKKEKKGPAIPAARQPATKTPAPARATTGVQKTSPPVRQVPTARATGPAATAPAATAPAATAGALSEETRVKLDGLQSQLGSLQRSLLLTDVSNEVGSIETTLSLLPSEIEELRTRGYVFRSFLENKAQVLAGQWEEVHTRVSNEIARHTRELEHEADLAGSVLRLGLGGQPTQVTRAESAIQSLQNKVDAAQSATRAVYKTLQDNVNQTKGQVEQIRWLLDQIDEASFQLHPAEDPVAACKAQYLETEKDGPEGVLYLTDERLFFEQKEEIATKKVLFIITAKKKVQQLTFEVPVGQIEETQASQKGFLGHKEILELHFAPEADLSGVTLRLHGADNEEWAGLIGRVKSGEITKERTRPKDEAAVEAARTAPTKCPTCGATLSVEIVRGMREITCAYCGSVIRL
jgi:hypothetical protein